MPAAQGIPASMPCVFACLALSLAGCAASAERRAPPPASPAHAYVLDEPTAPEVARAMTMRSGPEAHDCDCNGIPDSIDVLAGRTVDVNHNSMDDDCDDDPDVHRRAWSDDWRQLASVRDTAALLVRHECGDDVWIRYTVPSEGAAVRLLARAPSGKVVKTLLDRHARSGAYELTWDQTDDHGSPVADSTTYSIGLEFGGRVYTRPVLWRHIRSRGKEAHQ